MAKDSKQGSEKPPWEKKTPAKFPKANPDDETIITAANQEEEGDRVKAQVFGGHDALFADPKQDLLRKRLPLIVVSLVLLMGLGIWMFSRHRAPPIAVDVEKHQEIVSQTPVPAKPASIRVFSNPPGAKVYLKGKNMGVSPLEIGNLSEAEEYALTLEKEGYEKKAVSVSLQAGEARELRLDMTAEKLVMRLRSHPDQAEVMIDGKSKGKTPLELVLEPKPKVVKIELRKEGYQSFTKVVPVRNSLLELDQELTKKVSVQRYGYVTLEAEPWAIVYVNEKRLNRVTPIKDFQLPEGSYQIRFENPQNKKRQVQKIELKANQHLRLRAKLR